MKEPFLTFLKTLPHRRFISYQTKDQEAQLCRLLINRNKMFGHFSTMSRAAGVWTYQKCKYFKPCRDSLSLLDNLSGDLNSGRFIFNAYKYLANTAGWRHAVKPKNTRALRKEG